MSLEKTIRDYISVLDFLYQEQEVTFGIDNTPLNMNKPSTYMNGLLYYGNGKLTDRFYIKNVVSAPSFKKENPIYCIGHIKEGDYVCTCNMYGVCVKAPNEQVAFGKVVNVINNNGLNDKNEEMDVRLINVEFFE